MKVAVIGSCRPSKGSPWRLRNQRKFRPFCRLLGQRLAKQHHFLTVPCDNDKQSADWFCLNGFRSIARDPLKWTVMDPLGRARGDLPKGHIDAAGRADCVIVVGGANGTYAAGMTAVYKRTLMLPIGCFGGAAEDLLNVLPLPHDHPLRSGVFSGSDLDIKRVVGEIINELDQQPRLLIVHGRSPDRNVVKHVVEKKLKLHPPVILDYSGNAAIALSSKFSALASACTGAIVIATPDDKGASMFDGKGKAVNLGAPLRYRPRARENVWIEMGWLWASLGRDRILLLVKKEDTSIPSDIQEAVRVSYDESPAEVEDKILAFVNQLRH